MKVSIVTPSFNQAKFLEETILSVLNQTYKDIEYIIIDGGSTDGSIDIIKKYESKLKYWVSEKDDGQSDAINKGFEKCSGEIFAYLNSDDVLENDAVEKVVHTFHQNNTTAVVYGKCSTIDEKGATIHTHQGAQADFNWLLSIGMLPKVFQPACFFNKNIILRKPFFRNDLHYVMDYEFMLYASKELSIYFIDQPLAKYRVHSSSKTTSQSILMYEEKMKIQAEYGLNTNWRWIKHLLNKYLFSKN